MSASPRSGRFRESSLLGNIVSETPIRRAVRTDRPRSRRRRPHGQPVRKIPCGGSRISELCSSATTVSPLRHGARGAMLPTAITPWWRMRTCPGRVACRSKRSPSICGGGPTAVPRLRRSRLSAAAPPGSNTASPRWILVHWRSTGNPELKRSGQPDYTRANAASSAGEAATLR